MSRYLKKCPVCYKKRTYLFLQKSNFSYFTYPLKQISKKKLIKKYTFKKLFENLKTKLCLNCGHIFIYSLPNEKILKCLYENHYIYFLSENQKKLSIDSRESKFLLELRSLNLDKPQILEIGCNDGYLLHQLQEKGFSVTGIEPGSSGLIAKKRGINVYQKYYSPNLFKKEKKVFDLIICRHLVEHIKECQSFVSGLKQNLSPSGIIALEVPNVEYYINSKSAETMFLQHYHYFSFYSIGRLLSINGFRIIKKVNQSSDMIIFAEQKKHKTFFVPKSWYIKCKNFKRKIAKKNVQIEKLLKKTIFKYKKGLCWGAGGYAYQLFHNFPFIEKHIDYIIDRDHRKWGRSFVNSNIQIKSPESIKFGNYNFVIICSSMFAETIKKDLITKKFKGKVITIHL